MKSKEYIVSAFATILLLLFCAPIFAIAFAIYDGISPSANGLKIMVGLTNNTVANSLHSLILPLLASVVIFKSEQITGITSIFILFVMCLAIIVGFFAFIATSPEIFGNTQEFKPYIDEYEGIHTQIFNMIGMLIILFMSKLGVSQANTEKKTEDGAAADHVKP